MAVNANYVLQTLFVVVTRVANSEAVITTALDMRRNLWREFGNSSAISLAKIHRNAMTPDFFVWLPLLPLVRPGKDDAFADGRPRTFEIKVLENSSVSITNRQHTTRERKAKQRLPTSAT